MLKLSESCLKYYKTTVLYLSFLSLGLCAAIPGPTLLDLQTIVQTDINHIAYIYLARSSGYLLGSLLGGIILDFLKKRILLIFLFNLVISISIFVTPFCKDVYTLSFVMALSGASMGALDTGGNAWCLDLWKEDSNSYFQALHFLFGLGAFLSPLIAEPFLAQEESFQLLNITSSLLGHQNFTKHALNSSFVATSESLPPVTYAYVIISIFSFFVTLMFTVLFCVSLPDGMGQKEKTIANYKETNFCLSIIVILLASTLLSVYAGIEIGYGQMLATFAVKSNLHMTKSTASLLTSVYWGTFTLSRGASIILASKLSPLSLILTDFVLMFLASIVLIVFGNVYTDFLWIGTAVLGLALASFYPSTITWIEKHVAVNNKIASAFVVAASLGEMVVPLTVSQFVETQPEILLHTVMYSVVICGVLILILFIITKKMGVRYINEEIISNLDENEPPDLNTRNMNEQAL